MSDHLDAPLHDLPLPPDGLTPDEAAELDRFGRFPPPDDLDADLL